MVHRLMLAALFLVWASTALHAQLVLEAEPVVVATVDGEPVYAVEVERYLKRVFRDRQIAEEALPRLQASALEQIVSRRLVGAYLIEEEVDASPPAVAGAVATLRERLGGEEEKFAEYLKDQRLTPVTLRQRVALEIGWPRYLKRTITDAKLQAYFESHRRAYDGTEVKARHILLAIDEPRTKDQVAAVVKQATALREEITAGKLSFEEAVRRFSVAPSRQSGGQLGFLPRHSQMPEAFSQAAFQLQKGNISPPVVSPFGVHLIQVLEVRPGSRNWQDARNELVDALSQQEFESIANRRQEDAKIEYTGKMAHFDGATGNLIPAK